MSYIARLDELTAADVARAGGKGANLGELVRAGLPVPAGFVLTTDAYREFVESTGVQDVVTSLAALPPGAPPERFEDASRRIRELFTAGAVPEKIAVELDRVYRELVGSPLGEPARTGPGGAEPASTGPAHAEPAAVAVRSSATAEDLAGASFAGQQETFLNVRGVDALLAAVRDCWASLWTARAMAYRARQSLDPAGVSLAVVVQRMVEADAAGVMFTANPANGKRDELVLSAAWGLGESVVSGTVATDDLVVDKRSGLVLSRSVADKAVMTVYAEAGTVERPVPEDQRSRPVLTDRDVAGLAALGRRIEDHFRTPQDIEWARAGGELHVVQARPITSLPEPSADAPTDWTVPFPKSFYFRASIVEQLPDPLSPLFADLIDPAVTKSLLTLFRDLLGPRAVREGELGLPTVNGYAYYRYTRGALVRATLYSTTAMRLIFSPSTAGGQARWRDHAHPTYVGVVGSWTGRDLAGLDDEQLLAGVVELLEAGAEYYTSVQAIIPLAATTEVAFSGFYDRSVRRPTDPPATTFLVGFDSVPIRAEKSLYDLAVWTRAHAGVTAAFLATGGLPMRGTAFTDGDRVADGDGLPDGDGSPEWQEFRGRWHEHLTRFGHTVYNLDFRNAVPADDPAPMLATLRMYLRGEGSDPHQRQQTMAARRDEATTAVLARLDPVRRKLFERLLGWAQRNAPLREDALADVGLAWPQMRRMLAELGRRLVSVGRIDSPDDVFWLHADEVLGSSRVPAGAVEQRKALWRGQLRATPPQMLPRGTALDRLESFMPAREQDETGDVLKGTGASGGRVTATARVLAGPADFGRMQPGDVLVTSITTPAWTSLFAMASAVVTDIGGPLSHSSIVAREYGIPAVLGTNVATRRIPDGTRVLVDGDAGTVTLLDGEGEAPSAEAAEPEREASQSKQDRNRRIALGAGAAVLGAAVVVRRRRRARRSR